MRNVFRIYQKFVSVIGFGDLELTYEEVYSYAKTQENIILYGNYQLLVPFWQRTTIYTHVLDGYMIH